MALPILEKTWQFRTNIALSPDTGYFNSHRELIILIKNVLTDTVAHDFASGNIQLVSGNTYRVNPGDTSYAPSVIGNVVGNKIRLYGMTTPGNDGEFTITAQTDQGAGVYALSYVNAGGAAAEAVAGSVNVLGGNFSNPWQVDHSGTSSVTGTAGDNIDRLIGWTDFTFATGNHSAFVLKNPITGTQWAFAGETTTGSHPYGYVAAVTAPNTFTERSGLDALPTGTLQTATQFNSTGSQWFATTGSTGVVKVHMMMSSDGEQTRLFVCKNGEVPLMWIDATVLNPQPHWNTATEKPTVTSPSNAGSDSDRSTVALYTDNAHMLASNMPQLSSWLPRQYDLLLYCTSEGYGSATVAENLPNINDLTGDLPLYPVGLVSTNQGFKGMLGEIPDFWFTSTGAGALTGQTLPNDNTRQFIVVGDLVFPWDGSVPEFA